MAQSVQWYGPLTNSTEDKEASDRKMEFDVSIKNEFYSTLFRYRSKNIIIRNSLFSYIVLCKYIKVRIVRQIIGLVILLF